MDGSRFQKSVNILNLPVELVVYIFSFLPTIRDKVKLRYVSRTLRVVSETPSLWSKFIWPLYDRREELSVINTLRDCGDYVKRLGFPDHVTPSTLIEMLTHCNNLIQLNLPPGTKLDSEELRLAVQHMKHLEELEVQLSTDIKPLLQIGGLNELTVHVLEEYHLFCISWVEEWIKKHCIPCNFNLVTDRLEVELETKFVASLLQWNFTPQGYTSYFKLYYLFKVPLNLSPNLPVFQLEIGQTVILPFVKASAFGIMNLDCDILVLTDYVCNGKQVYKAANEVVDVRENSYYQKIGMNNLVASLDCVTEFIMSYNENESVTWLQQLAIACPNLQRLSLQGSADIAHMLEGLRAIALHCLDLRGLNLSDIGLGINMVTDCHLGLWEVLSEMKLTHLCIETCAVFGANSDEEKLVHLFQRCSSLQALQIQYLSYDYCDWCVGWEYKANWSLLSHFPALQYCNFCIKHSTVVQDVINSCKQLTVLSCTAGYERFVNLSSVSTSTLEQLSIYEPRTSIPEIFLETVSAHGGLVHIALFVRSVSIAGVIKLVRNSPKLLTCLIDTEQFITDDYNTVENLKDNLQQQFIGRKLFTVGRFKIVVDKSLRRLCDCVPGTDLFPLWRYTIVLY